MTAPKLSFAPLLLATLLLPALLLYGCGNPGTSYYSSLKRTAVNAKDDLLGTRPTTGEILQEDSTPLIDISFDAADMMVGQFLPKINKDSPIYFEPFTNRMDMGDPAPFGALVAEQVAARLAQRTFMIMHGLPPAAHRAASGEPSSEAPPPPKEYTAFEPRPCVMSGTYLVTAKLISLSARIYTLDNGLVMGAHSWTVPVNSSTRALLPQLRLPAGSGMQPSVQTKLKGNAHKIANPSGQPQNYVDRDLVR